MEKVLEYCRYLQSILAKVPAGETYQDPHAPPNKTGTLVVIKGWFEEYIQSMEDFDLVWKLAKLLEIPSLCNLMYVANTYRGDRPKDAVNITVQTTDSVHVTVPHALAQMSVTWAQDTRKNLGDDYDSYDEEDEFDGFSTASDAEHVSDDDDNNASMHTPKDIQQYTVKLKPIPFDSRTVDYVLDYCRHMDHIMASIPRDQTYQDPHAPPKTTQTTLKDIVVAGWFADYIQHAPNIETITALARYLEIPSLCYLLYVVATQAANTLPERGIYIRTKDDQTMFISSTIAKISEVWRNMIEDVGEDSLEPKVDDPASVEATRLIPIDVSI